MKTFRRRNGNRATRVADGKSHRKAGCQNRTGKGSFFVRRSRSLRFPGAKKPFRSMARDGTFSIGKTSNCDHLGAGAGGATRRRRYVRERAGLPENVPSNGAERFRPSGLTRKRSVERSSELAYPKTFRRTRQNVFDRAGLPKNVPA